MTTPNKDKKGMYIQIQKNSIKFTATNGETYYKNLNNFLEQISKGYKHFFAPISEVKK